MRRYCKRVDIEDEGFCLVAVRDFLRGKSGRREVQALLDEYGGEEELARSLAAEIRERRVTVAPIQYFNRIEPINGKHRIIGRETPKHQCFDYIAVNGLTELLMAKIGDYQTASIPGRGQIFAKHAIEKWIREPRAKYFIKLDIRKFYPSIDQDVLRAMLARVPLRAGAPAQDAREQAHGRGDGQAPRGPRAVLHGRHPAHGPRQVRPQDGRAPPVQVREGRAARRAEAVEGVRRRQGAAGYGRLRLLHVQDHHPAGHLPARQTGIHARRAVGGHTAAAGPALHQLLRIPETQLQQGSYREISRRGYIRTVQGRREPCRDREETR